MQARAACYTAAQKGTWATCGCLSGVSLFPCGTQHGNTYETGVPDPSNKEALQLKACRASATEQPTKEPHGAPAAPAHLKYTNSSSCFTGDSGDCCEVAVRVTAYLSLLAKEAPPAWYSCVGKDKRVQSPHLSFPCSEPRRDLEEAMMAPG